MTQPFTAPTDAEILAEIRTYVRAGKVGWTRHVEEQMQLRGFDKGQIRECLLIGRFVENPIIPIEAKRIEYKFTVQARVDFEEIRVVAKLVPSRNVVVITVFDPT